jgi:hypothetical protein
MKNICTNRISCLTARAMRLHEAYYKDQLEENGIPYGKTPDGKLRLCGVHEDEIEKRIHHYGLYVVFYDGKYRLQSAEGFTVYSLKNPNPRPNIYAMQVYHRADTSKRSKLFPYTRLKPGMTEQNLIDEQITYYKDSEGIYIQAIRNDIYQNIYPLKCIFCHVLVYDQGEYYLYTEEEFNKKFF